MLYQNADSENTVLLVIALVAIVVFILMLVAVFAIVRSERKTKNEFRSKDEIESSSLAVQSATPLPEVRTKSAEGPTGEQKSGSPAATSAAFFSEERPKNPRGSNQIAVRIFGGFLS